MKRFKVICPNCGYEFEYTGSVVGFEYEECYAEVSCEKCGFFYFEELTRRSRTEGYGINCKVEYKREHSLW